MRAGVANRMARGRSQSTLDQETTSHATRPQFLRGATCESSLPRRCEQPGVYLLVREGTQQTISHRAAGSHPASCDARARQLAIRGPVASRSSQIAARSIEARHVLRHDCSSQSTARSSQTVAQAVPFLRSQRAPRSSQGADFCAGGPRLTLFSSRRIADRTVADRSTLARRSRQRSTVVRTLAVRWSQGAGV